MEADWCATYHLLMCDTRAGRPDRLHLACALYLQNMKKYNKQVHRDGPAQDGLIDCIFANEEEAVTLCTELGLLQQPPTEGTSTESTANGTAAAAGPVPANGVNGHANGHSTDDAVEAAQRFLLQHTKVRAGATCQPLCQSNLLSLPPMP